MIDMWSVGCVLLEMMTGQPFFVANSSIDHLIEVIKVLGTPTKSQVKEMNPDYDLKDYKFPNIKSKSFAKVIISLFRYFLTLILCSLVYWIKL
jgi:serine/threonine protein kinase